MTETPSPTDTSTGTPTPPGAEPANKITTYREFWPFYLEEHRKPATRALHYAGTSLAIGLLLTVAAPGLRRL